MRLPIKRTGSGRPVEAAGPNALSLPRLLRQPETRPRFVAQGVDGLELAPFADVPESPAVAGGAALGKGAHLVNRALGAGAGEGSSARTWAFMVAAAS